MSSFSKVIHQFQVVSFDYRKFFEIQHPLPGSLDWVASGVAGDQYASEVNFEDELRSERMRAAEF